MSTEGLQVLLNRFSWVLSVFREIWVKGVAFSIVNMMKYISKCQLLNLGIFKLHIYLKKHFSRELDVNWHFRRLICLKIEKANYIFIWQLKKIFCV